MKDKIDVKLILRAVARILDRGRATANGAIYRGLEVESDYDGYTIRIQGDGVQLTILFHNRFELDYKSVPAAEAFYETIKLIVREPATKN